MRHNEYMIVVRERMKRYHEFKAYIKNTKADIADLKQELALLPVPKVPSLSAAPGGSGTNISTEEQAYNRRETIVKKIGMYMADLHEIEPIMKRIDRSLEALEPYDRRILVGHLIDNDSWILIASDLSVSESTARRSLRKSLERLTAMVFGPRVIPQQMHLVFLDDAETMQNVDNFST